MKPNSIKVLKKERKVLFYYEGGNCLILECSVLRALSPSAENKRNIKNPDIDKYNSVNINKVEMVGNYALRFFFDDGHNTGIFSWEYILEISRLNSNS